MDTVFLSYTYRSHPDHNEELDALRRHAIKVIEAMGLRVVDGVDVGGRQLDDALERRIQDADALIALMTPQADNVGNVANPEFVISEFQYARGLKKPTFRVIHEALASRGLGANEEHATYAAGKELPIVMKLMNTISIWKREIGRAARLRIEPEDLAKEYDESCGHNCEFQRIRDGAFADFTRARVRLEPGAVYAELPKLREGDHVRLRMQLNGTSWESRQVVSPFIGGVRLERKS